MSLNPTSLALFAATGPMVIPLAINLFLFCAWMAIVFGFFSLVHFLFSIPMRRAERARLFIDLLDDAVRRGQSAEEMVLSLAQCRDTTAGVRLHLVAAHLENGLRLSEALRAVPRFLPPQVTAMIETGEKLGDFKKIIPACREILRDRPAGVRSAVHYLLLVILFFSPAFVTVVLLTTAFVIPKFREVAADTNAGIWGLSDYVLHHSSGLILFSLVIFALLILATIIYVGGPGLARWFQSRRFPFADWLAWRLPWKQKRLQRTFSAMLAVLLDGNLPEAEAVRLAGDCTANEIVRRRARRAVAALQAGATLPEAVRSMDDHGEFHWRLKNAVHGRRGFLNALRGWHETLDAKAFQQEEATAHALTTGVVILNGAMVALIAVAMYGILIAILNATLAAT